MVSQISSLGYLREAVASEKTLQIALWLNSLGSGWGGHTHSVRWRSKALRLDRRHVTNLTTVTDPFSTLDEWMGEAKKSRIETWNAVTLATVDERGFPDARVVLLKERRGRDVHFFTNYESRKGEQLTRTPRAALVYHYAEKEWQARMRGAVHRLSREESEAYFATRPRESRIGAWTSRQSRELSGRAELEARRLEIESRFAGGDVPCPPFWGGFSLVVEEIELWVGHPGRLHDRALFRFVGDAFEKSYLYP